MQKRIKEYNERVKKFVKGTKYEKIVAGKNNKDAKGTPLKRTASLWDGFKELSRAEFLDKTFIIIFIFTIAWSNPWPNLEGRCGEHKNYKPGWYVYSDGSKVINYRRTHVGPGRSWCAATLGTILVDARMAYTTENVAENGWRLTTALLLVLFLLNYSYALISAHFSIVTKLEADH